MISLYTKENCPKCEHLKGVLDELGVDYEICPTEESKNFDKVWNLGINTLPVLIRRYKNFDNIHVLHKGFTKKNVKKFIDDTEGND